MKTKIIALSIFLLFSSLSNANKSPSLHALNTPKNQTYTDENQELEHLSPEQLIIVNIEFALSNEDFAQAHSLSNQLLASDPNLATAHFLKAKTCISEAANSLIYSYSLAQQAKKHFLIAEKLEPTNAKFKFALMSFYLSTPVFFGGNTDTALNMIAPITTLSAHYGFLARLAYNAEFKGKYELEQLINEAKTEHQTDLPLQLLLSLTLWQNQYTDLAGQQLAFVDSLKAKTQQDHNTKQLARYYLGKFSLKNSSNYEQGITALKEFIHNHTGKTNDRYLQWAHYYLSQLYLQIEQLEDAKYYFKWLINNSHDAKLIKQADKKLKKLTQS